MRLIIRVKLSIKTGEMEIGAGQGRGGGRRQGGAADLEYKEVEA
jgi:hypothetical protein